MPLAPGLTLPCCVQRLAKLHMEHLTMRGVECFVHFFLAVNKAKKKFKYGAEESPKAPPSLGGLHTPAEDRIVVQKWEGLIGLPALWSIALHSQEEAVGRVAIDLLCPSHAQTSDALF